MTPPSIGIGIGISRIMPIATESLDPDAAAYIALVEAAKGSAVTSTQRAAIDAFVRGEKSASRWDAIKRLYLPIWGVAAANAICLRSLTSGTFTVSGVTHAAGYVQGDGSTGSFRYDTTAAAVGMSASSGLIFALVYAASSGTGTLCGAMEGTTYRATLGSGANSVTAELTGSGTAVYGGFAPRDGVLVADRSSTTALATYRRDSAGFSLVDSSTNTETLRAPQIQQTAMCRARTNTTQDFYVDAKLGAHGIGVGLGAANVEDFTLAQKILWETCTGLTLP